MQCELAAGFCCKKRALKNPAENARFTSGGYRIRTGRLYAASVAL